MKQCKCEHWQQCPVCMSVRVVPCAAVGRRHEAYFGTARETQAGAIGA